MKSTTQKVALLSMLLAVTGCVTSPPIIADKSPCSSLVPDALRDDVPVARAPAAVARDVFVPDASGDIAHLEQQLREWVKFGVAQTGQLTKANEEKAASQEIVRRCETRDAAAIKRARPKFLGLF